MFTNAPSNEEIASENPRGFNDQSLQEPNTAPLSIQNNSDAPDFENQMNNFTESQRQRYEQMVS